MANLQGADGEKYIIWHSLHPAHDFPPTLMESDEDGEEENIWEAAYPLLYPFGEGGIE